MRSATKRRAHSISPPTLPADSGELDSLLDAIDDQRQSILALRDARNPLPPWIKDGPNSYLERAAQLELARLGMWDDELNEPSIEAYRYGSPDTLRQIWEIAAEWQFLNPGTLETLKKLLVEYIFDKLAADAQMRERRQQRVMKRAAVVSAHVRTGTGEKESAIRRKVAEFERLGTPDRRAWAGKIARAADCSSAYVRAVMKRIEEEKRNSARVE